MFRRQRVSELTPKYTSLFDIIDKDFKKIEKEEIQKLFLSDKREVFELDYLYNSVHFTHYPAFRDVVQILQKYNQQAAQFNQKESLVDNSSQANVVKLACMKFLYREMLCIAVKQDWQVRQSDIAAKLKNWYLGLFNMHSFLDGLSIKKRDSSPEETKEESMIRKNYLSNVFDEIDDYFRKKIDFFLPTKRFKVEEHRHHRARFEQEKSSCNLPLIDKLIYKREDERMREFRQKQFQKKLLTSMVLNKNRMKQISVTKFRCRHNIDQTNPNQKSKLKKDVRQFGFVTMPKSFYSGSSRVEFEKKEGVQKENLYKKSKMTPNNRLSLSNINGINLIQNKYQ